MTKNERRAKHKQAIARMDREHLLKTGIRMMLQGIAEAKERAESAHRGLAHLGRPMPSRPVEDADAALRDCADRLSAVFCEVLEEYEEAEAALLSGDTPCRKVTKPAYPGYDDSAHPEIVHRYFEPNSLEYVNFVRDGAQA